MPITAIVFAALATALMVFEIFNIRSSLKELDAGGLITIGIGVYVGAGAAVLALVGAILATAIRKSAT
jgi:hypothetical protein